VPETLQDHRIILDLFSNIQLALFVLRQNSRWTAEDIVCNPGGPLRRIYSAVRRAAGGKLSAPLFLKTTIPHMRDRSDVFEQLCVNMRMLRPSLSVNMCTLRPVHSPYSHLVDRGCANRAWYVYMGNFGGRPLQSLSGQSTFDKSNLSVDFSRLNGSCIMKLKPS
jgi:hypothetical protein